MRGGRRDVGGGDGCEAKGRRRGQEELRGRNTRVRRWDMKGMERGGRREGMMEEEHEV